MQAPCAPEIYTVSRLNLEARGLLEARFPLLWVEGELSNVSRPASGHLYFTLKDAHAQIRAAMFRNRNMLLGFTPQAGQHVLVRCRVSLYEARGDFQLIVEHMEEAGAGALRRAFDALKRKLAEEGLFDSERKRPLPPYPQALGVITSPTGAALRDVLNVLGRRHRALPVYIYPASVQGAQAAPQIVAALRRANQDRRCDVLLLVRGGGSLEDLWAFNEESVARAIADSAIPVVTGIGHETDFTIADFAADLRAPTPSAAAEIASPDAGQLSGRLHHLAAALAGHLQRRLDHLGVQIASLNGRLLRQHPLRQLEQRLQRVDELETRLQRATQAQLFRRREALRALRNRLWVQAPARRMENQRQRLESLRSAMQRAWEENMQYRRARLAALARTLEAVSPLSTLQRGYALALKPGTLAPLRDATQLREGDRLEVRLARGRLWCRVDAIAAEGDLPPAGAAD